MKVIELLKERKNELKEFDYVEEFANDYDYLNYGCIENFFNDFAYDRTFVYYSDLKNWAFENWVSFESVFERLKEETTNLYDLITYAQQEQIKNDLCKNKEEILKYILLNKINDNLDHDILEKEANKFIENQLNKYLKMCEGFEEFEEFEELVVNFCHMVKISTQEIKFTKEEKEVKKYLYYIYNYDSVNTVFESYNYANNTNFEDNNEIFENVILKDRNFMTGELENLDFVREELEEWESCKKECKEETPRIDKDFERLGMN